MKQRRVRIYIFVSAIIMLTVTSTVLWIARGSGQDQKRTNNSDSHQATVGQAASSTDTDKIVMMFPAGSVPKDLALVQNEINQLLLRKINATIELRPVDMGAWWDKINLMFAKNEQIDLLFTAGWMRFGDEVAKGRFVPLDKLLARYGKSIMKVLDPSIIEAGKINNKIYGVPVNKEFAATKGIVMRRDLVEKYDIDTSAIHKLSDFTKVFETIKTNEPDMYPLQAGAERSPLTFMMQYGLFDMLGDGPGVLDRSLRNLKVVSMAETKQFESYVKLMYAWNKAGYMNPDAAVTKDYEFEAVKAGKAFAYAESFKPGFDMQASRDTGMPMVTVTLTKPYTTTTDTTGAMFGITKTSKHPEKAMMLLNLLYSDKTLLNLLDWGVEGIHYVKTSANIIAYPSGIDANNVGYNLNQSWMFGNQMNSYLWSNENPKLWDEYRAFNEEAEKSAALGFVFNPDPVKNEIAACASVDKLFEAAINTGAVDPDIVLPMYREKLKDAGANLVIQEKQRQLDAWLASREAAGERG